MSLQELSIATGLGVSAIGNYRTGLRLMKPWDAKIVAAALGIGTAYLLGVDDPAEERLLRDFRALPENERKRIAGKVESLAITFREAVPDHQLEHLSAGRKNVAPAKATMKA